MSQISQISVSEDSEPMDTMDIFTDLCSGMYKQSSQSSINVDHPFQYPVLLIEPDGEDIADFTDEEKESFYQELAQWNNPLIFSSEHPHLDRPTVNHRINSRMDFCGHHLEMGRYLLDEKARQTGKRLSIMDLGCINNEKDDIRETHLLVRGPKGEYKKIVYSKVLDYGVPISPRFTSINPHEVRQLPFVRPVELKEGEEKEERTITIDELFHLF